MVQAKTYEGAMFGLGFVHAKDRLFQLHMTRMIGQGRLSELIGSEGIEIDKYIRQLGVVRAAKADLAELDPDERASLVNYAAGINKVVENIKVYPFEFQVLMTSFEPWSEKDSLACAYLYNAMASTDWFAEMLRLRLLEVYDRTLVDQLLPFKPEHFFPFENMETISDEELKRSGQLADEDNYGKLYSVEEDLLF